MVKCLAYTNKALIKAFNLGKDPIMEEDQAPENPDAEDAANIVRFGRHQILPAFWNLIIHLTKEKRRFSLVFRTFGDEIAQMQMELNNFCQAQHPCFCGQNKTQKPPPMNGDKGSKDMRLGDEYIGQLNRMGQRLEFVKRNMTKKKESEDAKAQSSAMPLEGVGGVVEPPKHTPTVYEYPPYHASYAGLLHHILEESNAAAIKDDREFWLAKNKDPAAGKLLLVDDAGGMAETKVQHIFFDGHIQANSAHCVDVRDVVSGEAIPLEAARDLFVHRVDFFQAIMDPDYFIKALSTCELNMSKRLVDLKCVKSDLQERMDPKILKELPPTEYLNRTIIPALLPAVEACQRDRPKDPIAFIAFYMLRHKNGYSKSLIA
jgi:hypothetical protein